MEPGKGDVRLIQENEAFKLMSIVWFFILDINEIIEKRNRLKNISVENLLLGQIICYTLITRSKLTERLT